MLAASPVATASVRYLKISEEPEALSTVPSESLGWRLVPIVIMSDTESESDGDPVPLEPEDIESDSMSESEMRGADVVEIESFITIESDAKTGPFKAAVTMSEAWNESDTAMVLAVAIASATPSESDSERLTPADMASLITIESDACIEFALPLVEVTVVDRESVVPSMSIVCLDTLLDVEIDSPKVMLSVDCGLVKDSCLETESVVAKLSDRLFDSTCSRFTESVEPSESEIAIAETLLLESAISNESDSGRVAV